MDVCLDDETLDGRDERQMGDGTKDEELTQTEPHKCAFIHWGKSQSNQELGT